MPHISLNSLIRQFAIRHYLFCNQQCRINGRLRKVQTYLAFRSSQVCARVLFFVLLLSCDFKLWQIGQCHVSEAIVNRTVRWRYNNMIVIYMIGDLKMKQMFSIYYQCSLNWPKIMHRVASVQLNRVRMVELPCSLQHPWHSNVHVSLVSLDDCISCRIACIVAMDVGGRT